MYEAGPKGPASSRRSLAAFASADFASAVRAKAGTLFGAMTPRNERRSKGSRPPLPAGFMVLWTTVVIDMIGFGIAIPVLGPFARKEFGASGFLVGATGAAFSLAQFVAAPILGRISDRVGRKPVIVVSLVGTALASVATGLAGSIWVLLAARAFDGASGGTLGVANAAVADLAPKERRAPLLGMIGAAFGLGFTIGPAIGAIAAWLGDRRTPFYVAAALAAVNAVAALIRLPETRDLHRDEATQNTAPGDDPALARTWRDSGLPLLIAASAIAVFAFSAFEQTFSIFGQDRIGFTESTSSIAFVIVGVVLSIVQGGLVGPAVRRVGELPLLRAGMVTTMVGLLVLAASRGWGVLIVALVLLSVGQGLASPTMTAAIAGRIDPDHRGEVLGIQQSWGSLGRVFGPLAGGLAFDNIGVSAPFIGGAVLFAVAVLLLRSAGRPMAAPTRDRNRAFARS